MHFFANFRKHLATKIPAANQNLKEYFNTNILDSIFFSPTDYIEIQPNMNLLNNSHS